MDAVLTTMVAEQIGPGEQHKKLISLIKEKYNFEHSIALRSPVMALELALEAFDFPKGSEIIISAFSPSYYYNVIVKAGFVPIYADVNELTGQIEVDTVQGLISPKTAAIVLYPSLGNWLMTESFQELGLPIIEDISQSYGSLENTEYIKPSAHLTILGLEEKDILTAGGGALLCAMNKREAAVLRKFSHLPAEYLLPDINAALAFVQVKEEDKNRARRQEIAHIFEQSLLRSRHRLFNVSEDIQFNWYSFTIVLETGLKDASSYAQKKDVVTELAFADTVIAVQALEACPCPVASSLLLRCLRFPLYPLLKQNEIVKISKVLATLP